MPGSLTLGMIGTFIRDRIHRLDGTIVESIGGLYHSLANAAFLANGGMLLVPVARVGRDFYPQLRVVLQALPGVHLDHLLVENTPNTTVDLVYESETRRHEITSAPMRPLTAAEVRGVVDARAIIINMITGEDIELEAVEWLAAHSGALLYFDFHTLALGRDEKGHRFYRRPAEWQRWIRACHIVQMNEEEASLLAGLSMPAAEATLCSFIRELLDLGCLGVHITLGERGALSGYRHVSGKVAIEAIPTSRPLALQDVIGCGDAFGAAFVVHYVQSEDFFAAARFAVHIATLNTCFVGSITREKYENYVKPYADFTN